MLVNNIIDHPKVAQPKSGAIRPWVAMEVQIPPPVWSPAAGLIFGYSQLFLYNVSRYDTAGPSEVFLYTGKSFIRYVIMKLFIILWRGTFIYNVCYPVVINLFSKGQQN